jgi:hypothetical protein
MKSQGWDMVILSEPDHEHLVAELHFDGQLLLLLDREQGRDTLCVAFPDRAGQLGVRIRLDEFIERVKEAAADLNR